MKQAPDHSIDDSFSVGPADDYGKTAHENQSAKVAAAAARSALRPVQIRFTIKPATKI
jgi:hypothetical protein